MSQIVRALKGHVSTHNGCFDRDLMPLFSLIFLSGNVSTHKGCLYMHFYVIREMELLLMPCWGDFDLNLIQWPPFLLASKLPIALDMAKDSKGKELDRDRERELQKRLNADGYMLCAVKEWEAFSGFEAETVSKFTDKDITSISTSYGIEVGFIRGVVDNSNCILEVLPTYKRNNSSLYKDALKPH
ncbi:glycosyl transferase, family 48 [Artemisia annua]|uniref:Glycosyl transferase, family 48 n=1 Tax=Artemisia annua TaxID=35608 RepID=A0A2U1M596_ARTAN|nr:glycosyl transferase, family 48 [Artemisia annua]